MVFANFFAVSNLMEDDVMKNKVLYVLQSTSGDGCDSNNTNRVSGDSNCNSMILKSKCNN